MDHPLTGALVNGGNAPGRRRAARKRRHLPGCLAILVALAVLAGGAWWAADKGVDALSGLLGDSADDYPGPGTGQVTIEVEPGDTAAEIGRTLADEDVVASVDAFISVANANPESANIQVGLYEMRHQMAAADALDVLTDPSNRISNALTIPEGLRVDDVVSRLAKGTDYTEKQFRKALKNPDIGLPRYAGGDPEGYLFPATYDIGPREKPVDIVTGMVDRWWQASQEHELESRAGQVSEGYTPQEIMTVASLVQSEGKTPADMAKIARVIYNRIENPSVEGTGGRLQIDATVDYALDRPLTVGLTQEERETTDSPYNTFLYAGLPPGPINSPGDAAIEAALNPTQGDWYYYVTVDLASGETKFAENGEEFDDYVAELRDWQAENCTGDEGDVC